MFYRVRKDKSGWEPRRLFAVVEFMMHDSVVEVTPWQCPSSAPAPPQAVCLGAVGSSRLPERGRPTGRPAIASGARASRLQSRRFHRL